MAEDPHIKQSEEAKLDAERAAKAATTSMPSPEYRLTLMSADFSIEASDSPRPRITRITP